MYETCDVMSHVCDVTRFMTKCIELGSWVVTAWRSGGLKFSSARIIRSDTWLVKILAAGGCCEAAS